MMDEKTMRELIRYAAKEFEGTMPATEDVDRIATALERIANRLERDR